MSELAEFCAARLNEKAAGANGCMNCGLPIRKAVTPTGWTHGTYGTCSPGEWLGVRCPGKFTGALPWPDPALVLREVAAMRALVDIAVDSCRSDNLHALAAIWCDHPDYRAEWKPDE